MQDRSKKKKQRHQFGSLKKALWTRIRIGKKDKCWEWQAGKTGQGYGEFWFWGQNRSAHRETWKYAHHQEIPAGFLVCHRCDNPACCNPWHLWLGTPKDNARDKVRKGRQPSGEDHPNACLTNAQAREIREKWARGVSQRALAQEYGVSPGVVWRVVRGKSYRAA